MCVGGSVVECSPAPRAARVRFPADASFFSSYLIKFVPCEVLHIKPFFLFKTIMVHLCFININRSAVSLPETLIYCRPSRHFFMWPKPSTWRNWWAKYNNNTRSKAVKDEWAFKIPRSSDKVLWKAGTRKFHLKSDTLMLTKDKHVAVNGFILLGWKKSNEKTRDSWINSYSSASERSISMRVSTICSSTFLLRQT